MRKPLSLAWAATILVAASRPVHPQDWASTVQADSVLRALVAQAMDRNPGLVQRRAAFEAAGLRIRPAGALPDPTLNVGVMDLVLPSFAFGRSDFTEVDIELMQEVPWPGTLGARTAASRASQTGARAELEALRRDVTSAMASAYYRFRYLVTALNTLGRQRELLEASVKLTRTRYATGAAPQSDPLQASLARDRLASEEAAVRGEYVAALAAVNALRDRPGGDPVVAAPLDPGLLSARATPYPPVDTLIAQALAAHPRLAARRAAVEYATRTIRLEQLAGRPDFSLTLRYGRRGAVGGVELPDFFSAFVGLRVPLWAGRKQHALAAAARADSAAAAATLRESELRLAREVTEVAARAEAGRRRLELLVDGVIPAARATVASVIRTYQVGNAEFLTLVAVQDALYRAELEAAAVAAEHQTHLVMLQQLTVTEEL